MKNFFKNIITKYKETNTLISSVTISKKDLIKTTCFSVLICVIIYLIPFLLFTNLYDFLTWVGVLILFVTFPSIPFLYDLVYYDILKNYNEEIKTINKRPIILVNSVLFGLLIIIILAIVFIIIL
ncbi:MAG: hypothetical protein LBV51_01785 [Acholeplasmatales bacterium]|jgi:hypothetical protein|nr:hypothetical protein [Acholeplasmatales bacterium]